MERNREYFKNLLADNAQDTLFDELFTLFSFHKMRFKDRVVSEKNDALVLLSGKLNAAQESHQLGMTSAEEFNMELSRVNFSILELLNELPDSFFIQAIQVEDNPPGATRQISISAGLGNGLFWIASVFVMMVSLGSLIQHNIIPFVFTLVAALVCMPPAYQFLSQKLGVSLSNSVRVLLVIVLTVVGMSFVPKKEQVAAKPVGQMRAVKQPGM